MNNKIAREFSHKLIMEELEARQLFSDGIEGVVVQELPPESATYIDINSTTNSTAQSGDTAIVSNPGQDGVRQELVFVDTDVKNYQELINDIYNQTDAERNIQVILLDNDRDGIQQITQALSQYSDLDAVHLISHGSDGSVDIGNSQLNFESLTHNQETIIAWGNSFTENGDFLIYGCDVAETPSGQSFVRYLSSLTNTDVAASADATGNSSLGGDWTLEFSAGSIETAVAPSTTAQAGWQGILATTTFQDGVNSYTGTKDTYLSSSSSGTNFGASGVLNIITPLLGSTQQSLISFDLSSIPAGAIVTGASVTFTASSAISLLPSVSMYKMLSSWTESTSTWSSLGSGVSTNNVEASNTADASWGALLGLNGTASFSSASLASTVQSWINDPASNKGWLLTAGITSVQFYSSEAATTAYRPQLSVTYTAPTPPSMDLDANNSSGAIGGNYSTSFTEDGPAVKIADIDATVTAGSNSISSNLSGMTITISNLLDGAAESLAATTSGTSITASYSAGVLTLSGSDTAANYQTVLRTVTYNNSSNAPNTTSRIINVVAIDPYGGSSTIASTTVALTAVNDAPTGAVTITGTAAQGQTLTAGNSLADADGLGAISYQWLANGSPISGATGNSYVLTEAEVGKTLTVTARYTDGHGTSESVSSASTAAVANVNDAPTGTVTLTGTVAQGQTLTAGNSLADADGLGAVSYQWLANGSAISGATGSSYVLTEAEVGKTLTVTARYTDGHGTSESVSSASTAAVANVNDAPTGAVTLTGTAAQGQTLTASQTLADADGLGAISYQWLANGSAISGATSSSYVLTEAEVGKTISVTARYTDGHGTSESVSSASTAAVANVNDAPTGTVTLAGTATQGQTLTASQTLADADGLGAISYQWLANGSAISGATGNSYVLTEAEVGKTLTVTASYTDGHGTSESVSSASTAAVANVNDAPTGTVTLTGTAAQGQTLTASQALADADGLGAISYQWLANGSAISGATGSSYALTEAEVGKTLTVTARYTDGHGTSESVSSASTAAVANVNDAPTGTVTLAGTATQGQTLTASQTLADADGLGAISYQWLANGSAISGATGNSYVLTEAEVGKTISVTARYTDGHGTSESVSSASTAAVANVNDAPTATATVPITGTATQGQTLSASQTLANTVAPPPPVINANPLGMPPIFGDMNTVVASTPADSRQGSFKNTANADSHDADHLGIIRPGNENNFDAEVSPSNKTILSAGSITAPQGAVTVESGQYIVTASWTSEPPSSMAEQPGENRLANNFRDLLASSTADYTVDMNRSFTQSEEQALWQHIAAMRNQIDDSELRRNSWEISVAVFASVTLTAGFVRWVLRSGSLLASLLSSVSLLKRFDPLPIFVASRNSASARPENQERSSDEIAQDKVEQLFSGSTGHDNS